MHAKFYACPSRWTKGHNKGESWLKGWIAMTWLSMDIKKNLKLKNCPCKRAMQNLKDWSIFVFKHNQNINKDKIITSYSL